MYTYRDILSNWQSVISRKENRCSLNRLSLCIIIITLVITAGCAKPEFIIEGNISMNSNGRSNITQIQPPIPPSPRDNRIAEYLGVCKVGMILGKGDSCKDGNGVIFKVRESYISDYTGGDFVVSSVNNSIRIFAKNLSRINRCDFKAEQASDGMWTIKSVTPKQ